MLTAWNPLSLSHPERSFPRARDVHRSPSLGRLIYETLVEAHAMSRDARRRYPFIGSEARRGRGFTPSSLRCAHHGQIRR